MYAVCVWLLGIDDQTSRTIGIVIGAVAVLASVVQALLRRARRPETVH